VRLQFCSQCWSSTVHRFTDFLVHEVDQDSNVVHIKSLGIPQTPAKKAKDVEAPASTVNADLHPGELSVIQESSVAELGTETSAGAPGKTPGESSKQSAVPWSDLFTARLDPFLSTEKIEEVKKMFLEGPEPPFVSDSGWSGRLAAKANESGVPSSMDVDESVETRKEDDGKKGNSKRGRDRSGRGGRGGRGGKPVREDHRKVTSDVRALRAHTTVFQTPRSVAHCLKTNTH